MGKRKSAKQERAADVELEDVKVIYWRKRVDETVLAIHSDDKLEQCAILKSRRRSYRTKCGSLMDMQKIRRYVTDQKAIENKTRTVTYEQGRQYLKRTRNQYGQNLVPLSACLGEFLNSNPLSLR